MREIKRLFNKYKLDMTKILLIVFFIGFVIIPLLRMLFNLDKESISNVFGAENFMNIIGNSVLSTTISTIITLFLAYLLAVCVSRTSIKFKNILSIILVLPMLIPSISHGMALVVMLGNNGILTKFLDLNSSIYGLNGIIIGSVLYAFPVAFLMFNDVLKYQDSSPYEAAKVLGIPKSKQFTAITIPYIRKPLISITLAVFTMIITDYGIPLMIGGKYKTLSVTLYQEVIGQLDFGKGSVYGLLLLIPAIIAFLFDVLNKDKSNSSYIIKEFVPEKNKIRDIFAYIFCAFISVVAILPIVVFFILAFSTKYPVDISFTIQNVLKAVKMNAAAYLLNSVIIAIFVSIIGTLISFITAYLTSRMKSKTSKTLHLFAITSAAIPGVVLGLSYVLVFKGSFLYATMAILIIVNTIHFISSPYLMMYNSLSKMNENIEDVGHTLGISRFKIILNVIIPQSLNTLIEMMSYFFVNSMMTISAVAFLSSIRNKPISLMINQFEAQMQLSSAAVVSLAILFVNLLIKGVVYLYKKISVRRKMLNKII